MENVIVLNSDFSFIGVIPWDKAMRLIVKGRVEVLKYSDKVVNSFSAIFKVPVIIRLVKLVRLVYKREVPFNKKALFTRDDFTCQYCSTYHKHPTVDHVIPQSKGGKTSWENCVTACKACNAKKADKSCKEVGMFLKKKPTEPTIAEFINLKFKKLGVEKILSEFFAS